MKDFIKKTALDLGFSAVGVTTAQPVDGIRYLNAAIEDGRIAEMGWLARNPGARCDPASLLSGARSVICLAFGYRFARGRDYHDIVRNKLELLWQKILERTPGSRSKLCVDTSPILEKALAERAGIGWIGKHTVLVNENLGSSFVLGEIITDIELEPDASAKNMCGKCLRCVEACPTGALLAPCVLDSRRCISYFTLAHKGTIPEEMSEYIADDTFGCDICQHACPYNRDHRETPECHREEAEGRRLPAGRQVAIPRNQWVARDCHVASLLAMTKS